MAQQAKDVPSAEAGAAQDAELNAPKLYFNRELSTLEFIKRVLAQAHEARHPLLERVRFLSLVSNSLDEFFMVRVSDLLDQIDAGLLELSMDGMTPGQQLVAIRQRVTALFNEQHRVLNEQLLPDLERKGIRIVDLDDLPKAQRAALNEYYEREIFPVLTPLAVDPGHPFPHISNLSVNLAVELAGEGNETRFSRVKIPNVIPRLLHVESILGLETKGKKAKYTFVWLEQLIAANLSSLFPGVPVLDSYVFRVVRDADIEIHQEEGADLRMTMERGLRQRRFGEVVLLMVETGMPERIRSLLEGSLKIGPQEIYAVERPLGLDGLKPVIDADRPDLKYTPIVPHVPAPLAAGESIFDVLRNHELLVHHPYDSFAPVLDLLTTGAKDDPVLAVKQTLYRVGSDSPVVKALLEAVHQGKQVAVLVELKARFDEASNIEWARELERAGVHVVYGFIGLKTHAKVLLIVRKEADGLRRYVHVGTGNYNVQTVRAYTDLGLLTTDPDFGADATDLFNYLTGYSQQREYRKFLVAPLNLREQLIARIEREIQLHEKDRKGHLIFKLNNLADREFIQTLYRASQAGVKIDLLIRGICCLKPGISGVSDNIRVISVVGRFLEHSRIYYFRNGGSPEIFAGSADLMPRNLNYRVEVLFPIENPDFQKRIVDDILYTGLRDNVNAWKMREDGSYVRVHRSSNDEPFDSQAWSMTHEGAAIRLVQ